jgi:hypothetical protein
MKIKNIIKKGMVQLFINKIKKYKHYERIYS